MHAFAGERIQINRQRGHQRFALAGAHFGDFAVVQHHAADQLYVEMAHAQHAARCFAADGKGFGQDVVQRGALRQPLFEFGGFRLQRFIIERLHGFFQRVDFGNGFTVLLEQPVVAAAEDFFGQIA